MQKRHEDFLKKNNPIQDAVLLEANEYSDCELNDEDEQNLDNDQHSDKNISSAEVSF